MIDADSMDTISEDPSNIGGSGPVKFDILDDKLEDKLNIISISSGVYTGVKYCYTIVSAQKLEEDPPKLEFQYIVLNNDSLKDDPGLESVIFDILIEIITKEK